MWHYQRKGSLIGHKHSVLCMAIGAGMLISAAGDNTIRIWALDSLQCRAVLTGHTGDMYSIALRGNTLFVGCQDTSIKVGGSRFRPWWLPCMHRSVI